MIQVIIIGVGEKGQGRGWWRDSPNPHVAGATGSAGTEKLALPDKNSSGKAISLKPIANEIGSVRSFLDEYKDYFSGATLVGSWALQHPSRFPDREGAGTSDVDIMLHENRQRWNSIGDAWHLVAPLEKQLNAQKGGREWHFNVAQISGGKTYVTIWGETDMS
jgi:hypothetical protein